MTTLTITLEQYQTEVSHLRDENELLKSQLKLVKEQFEWLRRQVFGQKSEKTINEEQPNLPGMEQLATEDKSETKTIRPHQRKKPNRNGKDAITLPDNLPVETRMIDIPEEKKRCEQTGESLVKIGEEITRKLAHKPGSYFIKEIIRPKYAVPKNPDAGIMTAPLPESLLERCVADESLLADILVKKFGDHLPLYRQCEILSREGILISRQILCQWVVRVGMALKPLYGAMVERILESGNIFIDETPIKMLAPGKGKTQTAFMWVLAGGLAQNPSYRIYDFYENRKHCNVTKILQGYNGVLHSDKYGAYEALANAKQFIWCPCWSHIRRKFFEAEAGDPKFREWVLRRIRCLFMFDRVAWARSPEERLRIRKEKEEPIIDELIKAIKEKLIDGKILPKSKLKEALGYFCGLIPYMKNYISHPFARLDNNVAERAVRPLAIGRKNWLFVGSEDGGEAAAIIYSLIQTCRALGVNPRDYLEDVMRRLMSHSADKIDELLPDNWAAAQKNLSK
ncbi:MAG: IS66 family transposase [Parachlamydiaceae bacterium]